MIFETKPSDIKSFNDFLIHMTDTEWAITFTLAITLTLDEVEATGRPLSDESARLLGWWFEYKVYRKQNEPTLN